MYIKYHSSEAEYSIIYRFFSIVFILLSVGLTIYITQTLRPMCLDCSLKFFYGIAPSFFCGIAYPFVFTFINKEYKIRFGRFLIGGMKTNAFLGFFYLLIIEIIHYIDGRNFDIFDIIATGVGVYFAYLIHSLLSKFHPSLIYFNRIEKNIN